MKALSTIRLARRRASAVLAGLTLSALLAPAVLAQMGLPGSVPGQGDIATGRNIQSAPEKPKEPGPDAIPGAKSRGDAAPATQAAGDMQPTDALFDAINRGDIASARDAVSRGADLRGVNILGMTPMELSVDLGRNDISFLLLSMRGEDSGRGSRAAGRDTPPAGMAGKTAKAGKPTPSVKAPKVAQGSIIPARQIAKPKLFANDGGTPLPSAGFLGFDSRLATN